MTCCCGDGDAARSAQPAVDQPVIRSDVQSRGRKSRRSGRVVRLVQWALPIGTLALMPKCPACVAGYVLLFTGIGLSFPAAIWLRWGLIAICIAALGVLLLRTARRVLARPA